MGKVIRKTQEKSKRNNKQNSQNKKNQRQENQTQNIEMGVVTMIHHLVTKVLR